MQLPLDRWRAETPGCASRTHLNNAGASLMPAPVLAAMVDHLTHEAAIGGYEAADHRQDDIAASYDALATLVGARPRNIAVTANATAAFIQAVSTIDFSPGDAIVTSRSDYTSNQIQYLALSQRLGVSIRHAADLPEGGVDPAAVRAEVLAANRVGRCRLVAISWVPTHSGLVQDVAGVGQVCRELGITYLVDACQAVGQIPIDVEALGCDYLSATARKFLRGPRGIGFLYAADRVLERGDHPLFIDMWGARWVAADRYEVASTARRFEDWEFPHALVLGQGAAVRYALDVGVDVARGRAWALADRLRLALARIPGVRVLERGRTCCALVTAAFPDRDAREVVRFLAGRQINTVASLREYGQLDFGARGVDTAIRLSPHYYNTEAEIDLAAAVVAECLAAPGAR